MMRSITGMSYWRMLWPMMDVCVAEEIPAFIDLVWTERVHLVGLEIDCHKAVDCVGLLRGLAFLVDNDFVKAVAFNVPYEVHIILLIFEVELSVDPFKRCLQFRVHVVLSFRWLMTSCSRSMRPKASLVVLGIRHFMNSGTSPPKLGSTSERAGVFAS